MKMPSNDMNYNETLAFLFNQLPAFERQGDSGYKPGLSTTTDLDNIFHNPHRAYRCVHVAGTNGKGSVSNLIAATLQAQGYKVGLFTSPHLIDFRERIRVNGAMISQEAVVDFMQRYFAAHYAGAPTFFELTTIMAFDYFKQQGVDYAVIEVGLGGRLDSSNIITPELSVITNISLDHTQFLGNTLTEVASEKAGIIKEGVPVVIGEAEGEVRRVFEQKAIEMHAPITFAQDAPLSHHCALSGEYQRKNTCTALHALSKLSCSISTEAIDYGFAHVAQLTGFFGRWQVLCTQPRIICDSGHNEGAFRQIVKQLAHEHFNQLHIVLGFMRDKNIDAVLALLPHDATYYFTAAHTSRALDASELQHRASQHRLAGNCYASAIEALNAAKKAATKADLIYVGGSMYVLSEILPDYV